MFPSAEDVRRKARLAVILRAGRGRSNPAPGRQVHPDAVDFWGLPAGTTITPGLRRLTEKQRAEFARLTPAGRQAYFARRQKGETHGSAMLMADREHLRPAPATPKKTPTKASRPRTALGAIRQQGAAVDAAKARADAAAARLKAETIRTDPGSGDTYEVRKGSKPGEWHVIQTTPDGTEHHLATAAGGSTTFKTKASAAEGRDRALASRAATAPAKAATPRAPKAAKAASSEHSLSELDGLTVAQKRRKMREWRWPRERIDQVAPVDELIAGLRADDNPAYALRRTDNADLKVIAERLGVRPAVSAGDTATRIMAALSGTAPRVTASSSVPREFLDAENSLALERYADSLGLNLRQFVDPSRRQMLGVNDPMDEQYPFSHVFADVVDGLRNGKMTQEQAVAELRAYAPALRNAAARARARLGKPSTSNRDRFEALHGDEAADVADRLADSLETLKLPKRKRRPTVSAVQTGGAVDLGTVDESRFEVPRNGRSRVSPKGGLLLHRGEVVPESFHHPAGGTAIFMQDSRTDRPGLTAEENLALDMYTLSAVADPLNTALRNGTDPGTVDLRHIGEGVVDLRDIQARLDTVIAESELSRDATLWRGTLMRPADLRKLQPGAVISEPGYLSTAADSTLARRIIAWRQKKAPAYQKPVLFKILAPKGTHAAVGHEAAGEVLVGRGRRMQVVRVDPTPAFDGTVTVVLILLPE